MFLRQLLGTSLSKEKKVRRYGQMPATFDASEESLEYIHPADLAARDPLQRSLPSLKRYSRHPDDELPSSSRKVSIYPTLEPTSETAQLLPDAPTEPHTALNSRYEDEESSLLEAGDSPKFPGGFELDPHPTSPAAAELVEAVEDVDLVVEDAEIKSFVEESKDDQLNNEADDEKLPAEDDSPPPLPDKVAEPDAPVPDYVEERKPRRPRNPAGFGSFLDNIVDLQAAGQSRLEPIVIQPMEDPQPQTSSIVSDPSAIDVEPHTPAPDVPSKSPLLSPVQLPFDNTQYMRHPTQPTQETIIPSGSRRTPFVSSQTNPLPTPDQDDPPPTPHKGIFGVDPGTASRIAELARRRRLEASTSGVTQHTKVQSEQLRTPISPEADEFGHRKGYSDVNKVSHGGHEASAPAATSSRPRRAPKQTNNDPYLPPTPDSIPSPSYIVSAASHRAELEASKQAQKDLQERLDRAMAELNAAKADNERLVHRQKREKSRFVEAMRLQLEDNEKLTAENKAFTHTILKLKSELNDVNTSLKTIKKEKAGWQAQLDSMQNQVTSTDKRIRCLDNVTRQQFESRQNVLERQIKRRGKLANTSPAAEVVTAVKTLNDEILQVSSILVEQMERDPLDTTAGRTRAQKVLGPQLTEILESRKHQRLMGNNVLLLQVVLEVFIVHWCSSIIDAFYPATKTFSDLLIEVSQKPPTSPFMTRTSPTCGKYLSVVQSHRTDASPVNFPEWVKDIIADLNLVLSVGGQRIPSHYQVVLSTKFTALVKSAYELRTALAEHDICGYLEIVTVSPPLPFQHKWMIEAHSDTRNVVSNPPAGHADVVLGTCGIGLQQCLPPAAASTSTEPSVVSVLKPQVVTSRVILSTPSA
ncbi:hypothetical protein CVT24_011805 [Panaeolus cyanescens]|uniref:Uncharacterized protein n=1 Tax=Panaeolus cyanescens TaxID=181874 RepID=A0A409VHD9_9AGAR|nr:hypothetical protein CVT24_011805 [Panaeolus cyanescens]